MPRNFDGIDNFLDSIQKQERNSLIAIFMAASLISANKAIEFSKIPLGNTNQDSIHKIITKNEDLENSKILKITSNLHNNIYQHLSIKLQGQVPQEQIAAFAKELSIRLESKLKEQAFIAVNNAISWEISDELISALDKIIEEEIAKKILEWQENGYLIRDITIGTVGTVGGGGGLAFTGKLAWCNLRDCQE